MIKLIDAILEINPNAEVSIRGNDYDKITWHNIEPIDKATLDAKVSEMETAKADEETQKENKKASGKQKLKDLGLDDDEIKALMGA
tara:strand:- start:60 stop:317 length:258 start_codon:yes stop_codon:yes gene_type:complete